MIAPSRSVPFPLRRDERLRQIDWPPLASIARPIVEPESMVVVCGGFEERAVAVLHALCEAKTIGCLVCLISYQPFYEQNEAIRLRNLTTEANLDLVQLIYDREKPAGIGEQLVQSAEDSTKIYVDISGMSRLLIVQIVVALLRENRWPVSIIYGEADVYPPTEDEFKSSSQPTTQVGSSYLSSGIFEIAAVPELASTSMVGEAIRLVSFPSFDPSQLTNLLQELQPTYGEFVHGVPPLMENRWREHAIRKLNAPLLDSLPTRVDHSASTLDYRETLELLLETYEKRSQFDRLVLAPTGSKMQAVAVGIFRSVVQDVQIVYPTPREFLMPNRHTLGLRQFYQLEIPAETFLIAKETL